MKKLSPLFLFYLIVCLSTHEVTAQTNNQIIIAFSPKTPNKYIESLRKRLQAKELGISYPSQTRLWQIEQEHCGTKTLQDVLTDIEDLDEQQKEKIKINGLGTNDTLALTYNGAQGGGHHCYDNCEPINAQQNVTIALIDTGIETTHTGLSTTQFWNNPTELYNGIDDDANGLIDDIEGWNFIDDTPNVIDDNSHGTHIAGMMHQTFQQNNAVANVSIMNLKTQNQNGQGTIWNTIRAIDYATQKGVQVINISMGTYELESATTSITHPLQYAIDLAANRQILVVTSAGNDQINTDITPHYPSSFQCPNLLSVMSSNCSNERSSFSNYGINTTNIAAPGENIESAVINNDYAAKSGTSMSAAYVAAVASLLYTHQNSFNAAAVKQAIIQTAHFANLDNSSHGIIAPCEAISYLINDQGNNKHLLQQTSNQSNNAILYNINGQQVWQGQIDPTAMPTLWNLPQLEQLPNGIYLLQQNNGNRANTQKIIKR